MNQFSSENNNTHLEFSRVIEVLRFPLALLIIFLHNNPMGIQIALFENDMVMYDKFTSYYTFHHLFSNNIARVAVPIFFFISGWLFFLKFKSATPQNSLNGDLLQYTFNKNKKNIFSIIIPYIIWNLIFVLIYYFAQECFSDSIPLHQKHYSDYTSKDWLSLIYYPAAGHLWFLRDLFVVTLFSYPLYFLLYKYKRGIIIVLILTMAYIYMPYNVLGVISIDSFYFWILGAFLCLNDIRFLNLHKKSTIVIILYIILLIIEILLWSSNNPKFIYTQRLGICFGAYTLILLTHRLMLNANVSAIRLASSLSKSSFFIYLSHIIILIVITKLYRSYVPITEISLFLEYCIIPPLTAMILFLVYKFMQKNLPTLMAVLNGGRR